MGQSEKYEIPGLKLDFDVGGQKTEAQGYVEMSMKGNTEKFTAQIDLTFCATFWGVELCALASEVLCECDTRRELECGVERHAAHRCSATAPGECYAGVAAKSD